MSVVDSVRCGVCGKKSTPPPGFERFSCSCGQLLLTHDLVLQLLKEFVLGFEAIIELVPTDGDHGSFNKQDSIESYFLSVFQSSIHKLIKEAIKADTKTPRRRIKKYVQPEKKVVVVKRKMKKKIPII